MVVKYTPVQVRFRCGSMIDFVVVHSSDCWFCMDTKVMRGAMVHIVGQITTWLGLNSTLHFRRLLPTRTYGKTSCCTHFSLCEYER